MRVLFLSGDYPPKLGGIATYGRELARAVVERPEVEAAEVLAFGRWAKAQENDGPLTVFRHPRPGPVRLGRLVLARAGRFRPDIIHVLTLFPEGFWASLLARPYLVSLYGTEVGAAGGRWVTRWAKGRTLAQAARLLPISRATAAKAARAFDLSPEKMTILTPGLTTVRPAQGPGPTRAGLGLAPDDFVVLSLGRLVVRKGLDDLLRSIVGLAPKIKLLIVGDGPEKERLTALAQELGLAGRAVFTGFVEEPQPFYRLADAFALVSKEDPATGDVEGFGIVILEAQAAGLPVVGTDSGGIPEAFQPGTTGLLVPPGDPENLGQALARLAGDPDLRARMGVRGRALVRERFTWPGLAQRTVNIYAEVLGQ